MAERNRVDLKNEFRDGERPTGQDFADFIDSYLNKQDDLVRIDPNGNVDIPAGINLKDTANGVVGSLRFNGGQVQVFDGVNWNNVGGGGGGGAFTPVGVGPHVAFGGGNVGIGPFPNPPTFRFEVDLGNNTAPDQRVRFGNAALSNGQGAFQAFAQFAHQSHADNNTNFALRQGPQGDVNLNAPTGQPLVISHNRTQANVLVASDGTVVIANNAVLVPLAGSIFQVNGNAGKIQGGNTWAVPSDVRLKQDIRPFEDGLSKLMEVKPVKFKYDGSLCSDANVEEVGVIGQEMEKIFPYMISYADVPDEQKENLPQDLRMYNSNALTYVMVNAIQELAGRVMDLEQQMRSGEKINSQE